MSTSFHELELELEGMGEYESGIGESDLREIAADAARAALEGEYEGEFELERDGEFEFEYELNPVRRVYLDAMLEMEHVGQAAAEAESAEQGEQFLPLLAPLAMKLVPFAAKAAAKFLPKIAGKVLPKLAKKFLPRVTKLIRPMSRSITRVGKQLLRNRRTRPLVKTLPTIARRSVGAITRQCMRGRNVTPRMAQQIVAQNTARVIGNPTMAANAIRRSRVADKQFHTIHTSTPSHTCTCQKRAVCPTCGK